MDISETVTYEIIGCNTETLPDKGLRICYTELRRTSDVRYPHCIRVTEGGKLVRYPASDTLMLAVTFLLSGGMIGIGLFAFLRNGVEALYDTTINGNILSTAANLVKVSDEKGDECLTVVKTGEGKYRPDKLRLLYEMPINDKCSAFLSLTHEYKYK